VPLSTPSSEGPRDQGTRFFEIAVVAGTVAGAVRMGARCAIRSLRFGGEVATGSIGKEEV
jgi:hypothetical protein